MEDEKKPTEFETPQIVTYTAEEILEELGPAQAGGNYFCPPGTTC